MILWVLIGLSLTAIAWLNLWYWEFRNTLPPELRAKHDAEIDYEGSLW